MPRFQRLYDPNRPGQLLVQDGEPVGTVLWTHDYGDRSRTGWFLHLLDAEGEPDGDVARRLAVSDAVDRLVDDTRLGRSEWLAQAETTELLTAAAALEAAEHRLAQVLDGAA